jgi:hypothetical protein
MDEGKILHKDYHDSERKGSKGVGQVIMGIEIPFLTCRPWFCIV